jgi:hypothetical protein
MLMKRRMMVVLVVAWEAAACGVANRARFNAARGPGEPLMPPLASFTDPAATRAALGNPGRWRVHSDLRRRGAWGAPAYRDMWVEVRGHQFAGHEGTLLLHFCNGRLGNTRFYPADQQAVIAAVERRLHIHLVRQERCKQCVWRRNVMVDAGEDGLSTHRYVSWSDGRLLSESDAWWNLYSEGRQDWE